MNEVLLQAGVMVGWLALFVVVLLVLTYRRVGLWFSTVALMVPLGAYWVLGAAPDWWKTILSIPWVAMLLLNIRPLRVRGMTRPFMKKYRKLLPPMSSTEREALDAGTVWWDGELFSGGPDWRKLMSAKAPALSAEERAFIDGPCEQL